MRDSILHCLPSDRDLKNVGQCLDDLSKLSYTMLLSFVSVGMQANFRYVQGVLKALSSGHPPKFGSEALASEFLTSVRDRLQYFIRHEVPSMSDGSGQVMSGKLPLSRCSMP